MLIRYLKFQEKRLIGGVAFLIKFLIKSLSNVSYLFMPFTRSEVIDKNLNYYSHGCHGFLLLLKFEMNISS